MTPRLLCRLGNSTNNAKGLTPVITQIRAELQERTETESILSSRLDSLERSANSTRAEFRSFRDYANSYLKDLARKLTDNLTQLRVELEGAELRLHRSINETGESAKLKLRRKHKLSIAHSKKNANNITSLRKQLAPLLTALDSPGGMTRLMHQGSDGCTATNCYYFMSRGGTNWTQARNECMLKGGDLAVPRDSDDNEKIFSLVPRYMRNQIDQSEVNTELPLIIPLWLGARFSGGEWRDARNSSVVFRNFRAYSRGEGMECLQYCAWSRGKWCAAKCGDVQGFVCEV